MSGAEYCQIALLPPFNLLMFDDEINKKYSVK